MELMKKRKKKKHEITELHDSTMKPTGKDNNS